MDKQVIGVALIFLIIGLGAGYVLSLSQLSTCQLQINDLELEIATVTNNYNLLDTAYTDLLTSYAQLEQQALYDLYVLNDQDYYTSIKTDLQSANDTIHVAMYSMLYDADDTFDWANDLIRELVYANNRGVTVAVIIENSTFFGSMSDNIEAYTYLSANGINVQLDNDNDTDHMKLIIIDEEIVYVGSHNWSESALYYNHETSVKIISNSIANTFKEYFALI